MKHLIILILLAVPTLALAQKNFIDQPYVETNAKVDTLVVPDKIFMSILLNEADSKNKTSVEEQEKTLEKTLKQLNIDTEKDLSLQEFSSNYKNYFLKGQNVVKSKMYALVVGDAVTAGKVLAELEYVDISNVSIDRTEYSKSEALLLELKSRAVKKSLVTAKTMAKPLNQSIGKALYISDGYSVTNALQGKAAGIQIRGMASRYEAEVADPINTEFQKVKFEVSVNIKYALE